MKKTSIPKMHCSLGIFLLRERIKQTDLHACMHDFQTYPTTSNPPHLNSSHLRTQTNHPATSQNTQPFPCISAPTTRLPFPFNPPSSLSLPLPFPSRLHIHLFSASIPNILHAHRYMTQGLCIVRDWWSVRALGGWGEKGEQMRMRLVGRLGCDED